MLYELAFGKEGGWGLGAGAWGLGLGWRRRGVPKTLLIAVSSSPDPFHPMRPLAYPHLAVAARLFGRRGGRVYGGASTSPVVFARQSSGYLTVCIVVRTVAPRLNRTLCNRFFLRRLFFFPLLCHTRRQMFWLNRMRRHVLLRAWRHAVAMLRALSRT